MDRLKVIEGKVIQNPYGDWDDVDRGWYIDGENILSLIQDYEDKKIKITIELVKEEKVDNGESPYIEEIKTNTIVEYKYNPNYGDERICKCGHTYYRHFDPYDDMYAAGCKYCHSDECDGFEEAE